MHAYGAGSDYDPEKDDIDAYPGDAEDDDEYEYQMRFLLAKRYLLPGMGLVCTYRQLLNCSLSALSAPIFQ